MDSIVKILPLGGLKHLVPLHKTSVTNQRPPWGTKESIRLTCRSWVKGYRQEHGGP